MKNTERFTNRVENYVKYRPGYPAEILDVLRENTGFTSSSVVADIGAGTGISTKMFLENGNRVFGAEPNEAMRKAAEIFLKDFPNFTSIEGTSENTTLEDNSVDFVTAAQAFHWFDPPLARAEFKRVLKSGGYVVLIWNERQLDSTDFLRDYEEFLSRYATDYKKVRHENVSEDHIREFFGADFHKATAPNSQKLDFEGLKGRVLSSSYMPSEDSANYGEAIETLNELFTRRAENGKIDLLYDTNIYYGQI